MLPVLLDLGPLTISSYGVSKALAALVAGLSHANCAALVGIPTWRRRSLSQAW